MAKASGDLAARVAGRTPKGGAAIKAYAPRSVSEAQAKAFPTWTGPLVLAPSSRADCTDIQADYISLVANALDSVLDSVYIYNLVITIIIIIVSKAPSWSISACLCLES